MNHLYSCICRISLQLLQVFESNAEYLGPELFQEFALPCIRDICSRVKAGVKAQNLGDIPMVRNRHKFRHFFKRNILELALHVVILLQTIFAKGAHYALKEIADSGYDVMGIDWTVDPVVAREATAGKNITLQGNFDPCGLYASPVSILNL